VVTDSSNGRRKGASASGDGRRRWPQWVMLVLFAAIAFESILLAVALKGGWLILLAPGVVCLLKAIETWRDLKRSMGAAER
jgi:hypothetical protein